MGFEWDTVSGLTSINDVKRLNLSTRTSKMALDASPQCRNLQILLGHQTSVLPAVPLIRLHSHYLQLHLNKIYRSERDSSRRAPLSTESLQDLRWIASLESLHCGSPIWPPFLKVGGVDGRIGRRLGHLLLGVDASGSLDLCCGCPSPYQCKGTHGPFPRTSYPIVYGVLPRRRWQCLASFFVWHA